MRFAPISEDGQRRLAEAHVAIVGLGALGSVLADLLARAGVGRLRLIDRDFVEPSNLQRQPLYTERDAEQSLPKAVAAAAALGRVNRSTAVEPVTADISARNAEALLGGVSLILDGTDNFPSRFLLNDVAVKRGIPWIYGGAVASRGVTLPVIPGETPCLRCLYFVPPEPGTGETCDTAGILAPASHVTASRQAAEALKLLAGRREAVNPRMVHFDLWTGEHAELDVSSARNPDCPACGRRQFEFLHAGADGERTAALCGRDAVQIVPSAPLRVDLGAWAARWASLGRVERNPFLVKLHLSEEQRLVLFPDGRMLVQGVSDPEDGLRLYRRYFGE
ncbi:ThiF family adenylyltransferase [Paenibacillus sp. J31TS4]|uniref:ThiF family adenylyltransferase n=1 Tax=Paenibacillus sp. J31TS4 TaxID=2807195 RepID=UPI001BCF12DE|nr:ThiF family adenylyltransferase [Paenibacillus sp. J31TS4]